MNEFENLKRSYITTVKFAIDNNMEYSQVRYGNEILHRFCNALADNSNYSESDKEIMKHELDLIKDMILKDIEKKYKR